MYAAVLMLAVTAGSQTPDCGRHGGCYGCYGGYASYSCHGCYGCSGCYGCYGGVGYYGCYGGGCYGCYGGMSYYGSASPYAPVYYAANVPPQVIASAAPARVIVSLPPDAKLRFNGVLTTSKSGTRVFQTPNLTPNDEYFYTLQAEVMRDGNPVRVEQRVTVRAGRESNVTLNLPQGVAAK